MTPLNTPPGHPALKNPIKAFLSMMPYQRDFFGQIAQDFDRFGDLYSFQIGTVRQIIMRHPDAIYDVLTRQADKFRKDDATYKNPQKGLAKFLGNGLLVSDGEFWKRQRKLMAPAFHFRRIASYGSIMSEAADRLIESWRGKSHLDVDGEMTHTTLDIVAKSLFSSRMDDDDVRKIGGAMTTLQHFSGDMLAQMLPSWVPLPARFAEAQALRHLDSIVYRVIREHREIGADNGDLLWMLLDARDDDGHGMTDRQIRDELVTLFLAGHETTANTLNWVWVLLAQNPDKEAKLHEELDRALGGRTPTLDDLKQLPYTEQVIKEAMRLYPPAFAYGRQANSDVTIGGYDLPKDTVVTIMAWSVHHDARWYPNPEAFEPERWTPEFEAHLPKGAYVPFGGGPRICIGFNFALMEANLLLAALAQHYQLRLPGPAPDPLALLTLRPKGGLPMIVQPRIPAPVSQPQEMVTA